MASLLSLLVVALSALMVDGQILQRQTALPKTAIPKTRRPTPTPTIGPTPSPTQTCDKDYQAPPWPDRVSTNPADITVIPTGYTIESTGVFTPDSNYPLVEAVKAAEAIFDGLATPRTIRIDVNGQLPVNQAQQFGGGDAGLKAYRAEWINSPINVAVRGVNGPNVDLIPSFSLQKNKSDGSNTPGVDIFRVESVTIECRCWQNAVVSSPQGLPPSDHGLYPKLQIYNSIFQKETAGGCTSSAKWGARLHGRTQPDFRFNFFEYIIEHALYADAVQGDSHFIGNTMEGSTRTMTQFVNRMNEGGPSGFGTLLIADNVAQGIDNDGGSDFTVVGHLGVVIFRNNLSVDSSGNGSQGSIVVWSDAGKGLYLNPNGYTHDKVIVQDHMVDHPNADRSHIAIAGAEFVEIRDGFNITGNRIAMDFYNSFSGPIGIGAGCFDDFGVPLSQYNGWNAAQKIVFQGVALTNAQIDNLPTCGPC